MADEKPENQVTVYIDNTPYQVSKNNNLLAGVLSQKLNLPYFCWHPSMGSVGACRQCAITLFQDEHDTRGRMVMACTTPVTDGMRIGLNDQASAHFREQVIAAMMTNHPHDCPVCAEGGECHLQDMTVMTGHSQREYQGSKRTFTNQYLGEFVGHEMNRCITCYRCTRFYNDYAGGKDFGVYGSKNQVYFGRAKDGPLESEFSGNLVEVCPTGVFTNKVFSAHYARKWDLQSSPSICAHCAIGCNTSIGERYGSVRRVVNRYNKAINGYFLCDRGRFGIGFVNSEQRIRQVRGIAQKSPAHLSELDVSIALAPLRGKRFIGVGSARASLESNAYLQELVGSKHFALGYSKLRMAVAHTHKLLLNQFESPSIEQVEQSDCVVVIGEDISLTAPRLALAVRQALRNASIEKAKKLGVPSWQDSAVRTIGGKTCSPLFSLQSVTTKLDDVCANKLIQCPDDMALFVSQLAVMLTEYPKKDIQPLLADSHFKENEIAFAKRLLPALVHAKSPLIITGCSIPSPRLLAAINRLMLAVSHAKLAVVAEQCNSVGVLSLMNADTLATEQVFEQISALANTSSAIDGLILLEQEWQGLTEKQLASFTQASITVIALDHSESRITQLADIVMASAAVSEGDGHYVNYQGCCQRYYQTHPPVLPIQDSWRWLNLIDKTIFSKPIYDAKTNNISTLLQLNEYLLALDSNWPISPQTCLQNEQLARQTHRASGRTAQMANISVHESKVTQTREPSLRFSMEGRQVNQGADMPFTWAPGWNSNQSINQFLDEINGNLAQSSASIMLRFQSGLQVNDDCQTQLKKDHNDDSNTLIFVKKTSLYLSDWQAAKTPEFRLMHEHNQLYVSTEWAQQRQWQRGTVVSVTGEVVNEEGKTIETTIQLTAVLVLEDKLPNNLAFGVFFDNDILANHMAIHVKPASEQVFESYQTILASHKQQALIEKEQILARLKLNDQTIPIRLISGGLDDE